jgi:alkane 1-monooxygenase
MVSFGGLSPLEIIGLILSIGVSSNVLGLSAAHELAHRINVKFEPMLSKILYGTVLYFHFGLEHVVGHHKRVATPEDPATARLGESFYAFLPRTVFGGFNSAWEFEAGRMKKQNLPVWSMRNPMVVGLLAQTAVTVFIAAVFGGMGIFYLLAQSFIAISLVESANYVVHYGLLRKEIAPGKYEPVRPWHSWNSSNWLSNHFLFNIQRHSDHHYKAGRRYQLLRHYDDVPQLPNGYAGMIVLALIPPLWRKIMDPRVHKFSQPDKD